MERGEKIVDILKATGPRENVTCCGWARSLRNSKDVAFLVLNDGSTIKTLQVVLDPTLANFDEVTKCGTGSSFKVTGNLVASQGKGQDFELQATKVEVLGTCDETYPLQKKRHSLEFLRTIAHLRPRTNTFGAVFRVRSKLAYAIHRFFQERGFVYVHTPLITGSDCEGAGEMFRVTTMDLDNIPRNDKGQIDYSQDFFGRKTGLTVSGQLEGELFATAFSDIYTFGPTFRAENSNTARHASEFWMIEPEMAFCDLAGDIALAQDFIKYITNAVLNECADDMEFFDQFVEKGIIERMRAIVDSDFAVISYTEAVKKLQESGKKFDYPVSWGIDLQTEHERYLTEELTKCPTFVTDYPKDSKAFYMYVNDDNKTVAASDLLVPRVGEIIGGSQREHRLDVLLARMKQFGLNEEDYSWYLDTRRFGSVPHAGFGLGFERALMMITGVANIRDVQPFPRTPGNAEF